MSIQTKTMTVKSDTSLAETTTTIRDTVTFDVSKMPNGITYKGLKAVLSFADPIQWNKASSYDALTVVWDDATHASYASKRRVPQNIELNNEFYWLRTADLDAQVEMYRQEVMELNGRVIANTQAITSETARAENAENTLRENIAAETTRAVEAENSIKKRNYVLLGDSFGGGAHPTSNGYESSEYGWVNYCGAHFPTNVEHVYTNSGSTGVGTSGFTGTNSWKSQLQGYQTSLTEDKRNEVTDIVVLGGSNENTSNPEALNNAITDFINYAKQLFPYARVKIGVLGSNIRDVLNKVYGYYSNSVTKGAIFIPSTYGLFNDPSYVSNDHVHLTVEGYKFYAPTLYSIIYGCNDSYAFDFTKSELEASNSNITVVNKLQLHWMYTQNLIYLTLRGEATKTPKFTLPSSEYNTSWLPLFKNLATADKDLKVVNSTVNILCSVIVGMTYNGNYIEGIGSLVYNPTDGGSLIVTEIDIDNGPTGPEGGFSEFTIKIPIQTITLALS